MPTIIDRYMLRQFVQVLIICLMSLIGLYIVIDAFSHLDHFVEAFPPTTQLYIMTIREGAAVPFAAANNEAIRALPAKYPNVHVIDWAAESAACPGDCFYNDGVGHLKPDGEAYYPEAIYDGPPTLVSEEPLTVEYKLNPDAQWNDGKPVTVNDMIYVWYSTSGREDHCPQDVCAPASTDWGSNVESIEETDENTITVTYVDASGRSRTQRNVYIPWSLTVTPISNSEVGSVQASSLFLVSRLNCSITTSDGTVLSSNTNNAAQTSC